MNKPRIFQLCHKVTLGEILCREKSGTIRGTIVFYFFQRTGNEERKAGFHRNGT